MILHIEKGIRNIDFIDIISTRMPLSKLLLLCFCILNVSAFIIPASHKLGYRAIRLLRCSQSVMISDDDNIPYLDKLDKNNGKKVERLKSIRDNITKYMEDKKPKNSGYSSRYNQNAIIPIDFDKLFLNLNQIAHVYISADYDRAVFYLSDSRRFVYYIRTPQDKELFEKIIKYISHPVKIRVICDKTLFTDKFGYLYTDSP